MVSADTAYRMLASLSGLCLLTAVAVAVCRRLRIPDREPSESDWLASLQRHTTTEEWTRIRAVVAGRFRRGVSLMEVLVSIFVIMVGLLGVAALISVGRMHTADIEQVRESAAAVQAAKTEFNLRGWVAPSEPCQTAGVLDVPCFVLYDPTNAYAATLYPGYRPIPPPPQVLGLAGPVLFDPIGIAQGQPSPAANPTANLSAAGAWPYSLVDSSIPAPQAPYLRDATTLWHPSGTRTPIALPRVSKRMSPPVYIPIAAPMSLAMASRMLASHDDLAVPTTGDGSRPEQITRSISGQPAQAEIGGNYTWAVMVTPLTPGGMAAQQKRFTIDVIVYHKRAFQTQGEVRPAERTVWCNMTGVGFSGGDVKLTAPLNRAAWLGVKKHSWILLCGPDSAGVIHRAWYEVRSAGPVEEDPSPNPPGGTPLRWMQLVQLNGIDWPCPNPSNMTAPHWCDKETLTTLPDNDRDEPPPPPAPVGAPVIGETIAVLCDDVTTVKTFAVTVP